MDLYKNPPLKLRLLVIAAGILVIILAAKALSLTGFFVGMGIAIFGSIWGSKWQIDLIKKIIVGIFDTIKALFKLPFDKN